MATDSLPAEIEYSILLRLPVKTLKRFQCVSKPWYALISSPQFQKDHFRRAQQRGSLLLTLRHDEADADYALLSKDSRTSSIDPFTFRFSTYTEEGTLVKKFSATLAHPFPCGYMMKLPFTQSCLGLVLLSSPFYPPILICNPSTEEIISLPPTRETNYCVGFGYIPSTEEFKVVRFFYHNRLELLGIGDGDGKRICRCEVFTLGTSDWRVARTPPPFNVDRGCAPFLHGALHFLPYFFHHVQDSHYIAVLEIETEEYNEGIRLPDYYYALTGTHGSYGIHLLKLGGSLSLTFDFGEESGMLHMWILKDYHKAEWVNAHTINIFPVCPYATFDLMAYPVEDTGNDIILINFSDEEGIKILQYNPQDGVIKVKIDKESTATYYIESFYPLHGQVGWNLT